MCSTGMRPRGATRRPRTPRATTPYSARHEKRRDPPLQTAGDLFVGPGQHELHTQLRVNYYEAPRRAEELISDYGGLGPHSILTRTQRRLSLVSSLVGWYTASWLPRGWSGHPRPSSACAR